MYVSALARASSLSLLIFLFVIYALIGQALFSGKLIFFRVLTE